MGKINTEIELLIKTSVKEYIYLCDRLMWYPPFSYEEKSHWNGWTHGIHIRYQHKTTNQIVEAPYARTEKAEDLDAYFWREFIKTTPKYLEIETFLEQSKLDERGVLKDLLNEAFFKDRKIEIPQFKRGDILQLRDSIFKNQFISDKYWQPCYYYEDPMVHIYGPMENNYNDLGCQAPTVLGGIKTLVQEIVTDELGFESLHTDLFIIDLPFAYEKNQFVLLNDPEYKKDEKAAMLVEDLSSYENASRQGIISPSERECSKVICTRQYFDTAIRARYHPYY